MRATTRGWHPPDERSYCYALGLYLGDGHISNVRWPFLRVVLDPSYPAIVEECSDALRQLFPASSVRQYHWPRRGAAIVQVSSRALLTAFPQHGPGPKHKRPMALAPWQLELTTRHPKDLLRGLIHSDGARCMNRFSVELPSGRLARYAYPRYFFTNLSADIRRIFCEHCQLLGVRCTRSSHKNISISHRHSVAILDAFVGPKR